MEGIKWNSYKNKVKRYKNIEKRVLEKTCTPKELAEAWGISYTKVLRLARIEGAPVLRFGRDIRFVLSKLDDFLEEHIGENLL